MWFHPIVFLLFFFFFHFSVCNHRLIGVLVWSLSSLLIAVQSRRTKDCLGFSSLGISNVRQIGISNVRQISPQQTWLNAQFQLRFSEWEMINWVHLCRSGWHGSRDVSTKYEDFTQRSFKAVLKCKGYY